MKRNKITILVLVGIMLLSSFTFAYAEKGYKNTNAQKNNIKDIEEDSYKIKITKEVVKYEKDYMQVYLEIPIISGLTDEIYQKILNNNIKNDILDKSEKFEEKAKKVIEEAHRQGKEPKDMQYILKYEYANSCGVLTIILETYSYLGGANGSNNNYYYNTLIEENKSIQLSDLFKLGSDYKETINEEIKTQIAERVKKGEVFFEGEFKTIADNHGFYIQDNKLILTFPEYSIAPKHMGIVEFEIPLFQLKDLLRERLPLIEGDLYYNDKYNFEFKIPYSWKDNVYVKENFDVANINLEVDFIYIAKDKKYSDYNLMSIIVMDKVIYNNLSKSERTKLGNVIADTKEYVYLIKTYDNPYIKDTLDYYEFKKMSSIIDSAKGLFRIKDEYKNLNAYKWVIINGKKENLNKDMYRTENGVLMIPVRKVSEKLGYEVKWNPQNKIVTLNGGEISVIFVGKYTYKNYETIVELEEVATINNGTVFVPISYFEKVLGLKIEVNNDGMLIINKK